MDRLTRSGTTDTASQNELFALLDHYCDPRLELSASSALQCQVVTRIKNPNDARAQGIEAPLWMQASLFRHLYQIDGKGTSSASTATDGAVDFVTSFAGMASLEEAGALVGHELAKRLAKILSVPVANLDPKNPMHLFELDSLVAVELRNWFVKEFNADIAIFEILGGATLSSACIAAAEKIPYRQASWTHGGI